MTHEIQSGPSDRGSFHLTTAERAQPIPSITWALMSVLLTFAHVMLWAPMKGAIGKHSLPVALLAAAIAWFAFVRREQVGGRGWSAFVRKGGSRLAAAVAVVVSTMFVVRAAGGAFFLGD